MITLCVGRGDEHREAGDALEVILLGVAYAPVAVVSLGMGIDVHFERRGHVPGARSLNSHILCEYACSAGAVEALHRGIQNALIRRIALLAGTVEIIAVFEHRADRSAGNCAVGRCAVYCAVACAVNDGAHIAAADNAAGVCRACNIAARPAVCYRAEIEICAYGRRVYALGRYRTADAEVFNYGAVARHLAEESLIVGRAVYVQILERIALTVEYSLERLLHRADRSPRGSACGRVA